MDCLLITIRRQVHAAEQLLPAWIEECHSLGIPAHLFVDIPQATVCSVVPGIQLNRAVQTQDRLEHESAEVDIIRA